jgi:hypothetical protein
VFQMYGMIELDCSGVSVSSSHCGEFRMVAVEACDGVRKMRTGAASLQVGVALRATKLRNSSQTKMPTMLFVARSAIRRENLVRVMDRTVMARFAALIGCPGAEHASLLQMASATFLGKNGVRTRNSSAAINVVVASEGVPTQPQNCGQRNGNGQNESQAPEGVWALEIT